MTARDTLVRVGAALACVPGPAAWAGVALGVVDPHVGSYVMVVGVCLGFVLMLAGPWVGGDATPRQRLTDTLVLWTLMSAGAQLGFVLGPVSGLASYLAIPTQGIDQTLTRHKLGLELGFGPVVVGASLQLDALTLEPVRGVPQGPLSSQTIGIHVGYRFPAFELR